MWVGLPGRAGSSDRYVRSAATTSTDLIVTNYEWQTNTNPFGGGIDNVTASATVMNNTGQTLEEWSAEMRCLEAGVIVADDQVSAYSLSALANGEAARIQFSDHSPTGTPTECELSFRGELTLTY